MTRGDLAWFFLEPDTGLDHCLRILLSCFRSRTSGAWSSFRCWSSSFDGKWAEEVRPVRPILPSIANCDQHEKIFCHFRRGLATWVGRGRRHHDIDAKICSCIDIDPIRYPKLRSEWPNGQQSYWAYLSTSGVAHNDICLVYATVPPIFVAVDREKLSRAIAIFLKQNRASSDQIQSSVACGVRPSVRPKCVGDDGSNYCISHGPRPLWHSGRPRDRSLAVHLSRSLRRFFCCPFLISQVLT